MNTRGVYPAVETCFNGSEVHSDESLWQDGTILLAFRRERSETLCCFPMGTSLFIHKACSMSSSY